LGRRWDLWVRPGPNPMVPPRGGSRSPGVAWIGSFVLSDRHAPGAGLGPALPGNSNLFPGTYRPSRRPSNWLHGRFYRVGRSWPLETLPDAPNGRKGAMRKVAGQTCPQRCRSDLSSPRHPPKLDSQKVPAFAPDAGLETTVATQTPPRTAFPRASFSRRRLLRAI